MMTDEQLDCCSFLEGTRLLVLLLLLLLLLVEVLRAKLWNMLVLFVFDVGDDDDDDGGDDGRCCG